MMKKIRAGRKPSSVPPVTRRWWSFIWALDCSKARATYPEVSDGPSLPPCGGRFPMWSCSRRGFPSTRHCCRDWWALTPPFHPYPLRGGLLFCGTVHGVAPCPVSGPPCPAELGLSSPRFRGAITSPALKSKNNCKMQIVKCKSQVDRLNFPILHFAFCILHYRSFSSIALLASASASLFISRGMYCTSTLPILAISSLAFVCSGFKPSFFTL